MPSGQRAPPERLGVAHRGGWTRSAPPGPAARPHVRPAPTPGNPIMPGVRIFITGGTFDKAYDEIRGRLHFHDTHLPDMLRLGRCRLEVEIRTLMMVDSREMTEVDRKLIARNCRETLEDRIVITHGTDTMVDTARVLAREVKGKTIILTGAMIPIAFGSSDGLFNLGGALTAVQALPSGVHIVMNGRIFAWDNVRKDINTGVFETRC